MSTPLNPIKTTVAFVQTIASHSKEFAKSKVIAEKEYAIFIGNMVDSLKSHLNMENGDNFEQKLIREISEQNYSSYLKKYRSSEDEVGYVIEARKSLETYIEKYNQLKPIRLPATSEGVACLAGIVNQLAHGLDELEKPISRLVHDMESGLNKYAVILCEKMPKAIPELPELMMNVSSTLTWGDSYFRATEALRGALYKLIAEGYYENDSPEDMQRTFYPTETFSFLINQYVNSKEVIAIPTEGVRSNVQMLCVTSQTGKTVSIQNDIEKATESSIWATLKLLNDMDSFFKGKKYDNFTDLNGNRISEESANNFKATFSAVVKVMNNYTAPELSGYRMIVRQIEKEIVSQYKDSGEKSFEV